MTVEKTHRDLSWHLDHAAGQLDRRLRNGDRIAQPRDVEHFAVFPFRLRAQKAAREFEELGYTTSLARMGLQQVLTIGLVAAVDEATTTRVVTEIVGVVEKHHGLYDGWRARIVPAS